MRSCRYVLVAIATMVMAGCAGGPGESGLTRITTLPRVTSCELRGNGFDRVVETPTKIRLPKKSAPVTFTCRAQGFRTTRGTLDTRLKTSVYTNLLMGSMLGFVVDVGTGAARKYPSNVTIILEPVSFRTVAARDGWYNLYRMYIVHKWEEKVMFIEADCSDPDDNDFACSDEIVDVHTRMLAELEKLESLRKRASILPRIAFTPRPAPFPALIQ